MQLTAKDIRMNAHAANKDEALAVLGGVLVEDALTTPEYLQGIKTVKRSRRLIWVRALPFRMGHLPRAMLSYRQGCAWCIF